MYHVRKGFAFSVVLSFIYLWLIIVLTGDVTATWQASIRVFIFVGIAGVITFLSAKRKQVEEELRQHRANLEKVVLERTAELRRNEEELLRRQQQLRVLASELVLAEERERRRIATGLHDHACQTLVLSKMKLQRVQRSLPAEIRSSIVDVSNSLDGTIESVREMTFDLSSPALYRFGLEVALKELLQDKLKAQPDLRYHFRDDGVPKPAAEDVRIALFQSVRELLTNVIKHARAHEVALDISRCQDSIKIMVTDDGVGFDAANVLAAPSRSRGFGLFSIRERLDLIGGAFYVESQSGQGSQFTLVAPMEMQGPITKETCHAD